MASIIFPQFSKVEIYAYNIRFVVSLNYLLLFIIPTNLTINLYSEQVMIRKEQRKKDKIRNRKEQLIKERRRKNDKERMKGLKRRRLAW